MVEIDDQRFGGVVAVHRDDGRSSEPGRFDADEPGRIVLYEHFDVVALCCPEPMQHDPARAMVLILLDIEKRRRIAGPHNVSGRAPYTVREIPLAFEVANRDGQDLGAEVVRAPGEFRMVGRMAPAGEMKERLSFGPRVAIDQHGLRAALAGLAAIDAPLAAGTKARVIGPRPVDLRRLAVVFLEARAHFAPKLFLQPGGRRQNRVGIGVFGLEQRADVGGQPARIAQDLAPVVGPDPGVIVGPGKTVGGELPRSRLGARWRRDRGLGAGFAGRPGSGAGHGASARRDGRAPESAQKAAGTSDGEAHNTAAPAARSSSAPP